MPEVTATPEAPAQKFDVQVKLPATLQLLRDIVITACEGGIGYWSQLSVYKWRNPDAPDDASMADDGTYLPFPEVVLHELAEDEGDYKEDGVKLTPEMIVAGMQKALEQGNHSSGNIIRALAENDAGHLDADDADNIVQFGVLGSIVYG